MIEGEYNLQKGMKGKIRFLKDELTGSRIDLFIHKMSQGGRAATNLVKKIARKNKMICMVTLTPQDS